MLVVADLGFERRRHGIYLIGKGGGTVGKLFFGDFYSTMDCGRNEFHVQLDAP